MKTASDEFVVFQVTNVSLNSATQKTMNAVKTCRDDFQDEQEIADRMKEISAVLRDDHPPGLLPKRCVDHVIETNPGSEPPHCPVFQLYPAELLATKAYVVDLFQKEKIRSR